jgi:hypothetical protein
LRRRDYAMKKKFTEEQIAFALKQAEHGTSVSTEVLMLVVLVLPQEFSRGYASSYQFKADRLSTLFSP